jgi:hypothetical protein
VQPLFVILNADGAIKRTKGNKQMMIYTSLKAAKGCATDDGDSIVYLELDHETEPVFIRARKLVPDGGE